MKYTYDLDCPVCKGWSIIETTDRTPLPVIYCNECDYPTVLEITRIHIDGVAINHQRSN